MYDIEKVTNMKELCENEWIVGQIIAWNLMNQMNEMWK